MKTFTTWDDSEEVDPFEITDSDLEKNLSTDFDADEMDDEFLTTGLILSLADLVLVDLKNDFNLAKPCFPSTSLSNSHLS